MTKTKLIDIHEVAGMLRLSVNSVSDLLRMRRNGQSDFPLPVTKVSRKHMWSKRNVEQYILRLAAHNMRPMQKTRPVPKEPPPIPPGKYKPETIATLRKFGLDVS